MGSSSADLAEHLGALELRPVKEPPRGAQGLGPSASASTSHQTALRGEGV